MTKFEYKKRMLLAKVCLKIWGGLQLFGIYPSLNCRWFNWIVSQTGFVYMEPYSPEKHGDWQITTGDK